MRKNVLCILYKQTSVMHFMHIIMNNLTRRIINSVDNITRIFSLFFSKLWQLPTECLNEISNTMFNVYNVKLGI